MLTTACVEIAHKKLRKSLKKPNLLSFFEHVYLVILGIRDAYLVDCFCSDTSTLEYLNKIIGNQINAQTSPNIIIVCLEQDFLIVNKSAFINKYNYGLDSITVVNVSQSKNNLCSSEEKFIIYEQIRRWCAPLYDICVQSCDKISIVIDSSDPELCPVFLAGWLLGYSCVYRIDKSQQFSNQGNTTMNSLAMCPLRKYLFEIIYTNTQRKVDIMEFTIPLDCMSSQSLETSLFDEIINSKMHSLNERVNRSSADRVGDVENMEVQLLVCDVEFPSLIF